MATFDPAISFRGFQPGMAPDLGSSNLSNAIPLAGRFSKVLPATNNMFAPPTVGAAQPPAIAPGTFTGYPSLEAEQAAAAKDPFGYALGKALMEQQKQNTPEARAAERKQYLEDQLAYNKQQGDQQMKYRMINDIIANIGQGTKAAFSRYSDPAALAASLGAVGDTYSRASANTAALSQLGSGQPSRQYFTA
jgi:hypothetical protein